MTTPFYLVDNPKNSSFFNKFISSISTFGERYGRELILLGGTFLLASWILRSNDPLKKEKEEANARKAFVAHLLKKRNKKDIENIHLNDYEFVIASSITLPEEMEISFDDVGGLEKIKKRLLENVIMPLRAPQLYQRGKLNLMPRGILFYGPPGTGKTLLAKALAASSDFMFINLDISNITNKWLGESEKMVKATFTLAEKLAPAIIFIDEVDCLFRKRNSQDHEVHTRIKALFMSLWDGLTSKADTQVIVIGATNRPYDIDDALARRMPETFHIGLPNKEERTNILKVINKDEPLEDNFDFERIAGETDGYSGSDLHSLSQRAARGPIREYLSTKTESEQDVTATSLRRISIQDFLDAKHEGTSSNTISASSSLLFE